MHSSVKKKKVDAIKATRKIDEPNSVASKEIKM